MWQLILSPIPHLQVHCSLSSLYSIGIIFLAYTLNFLVPVNWKLKSCVYEITSTTLHLYLSCWKCLEKKTMMLTLFTWNMALKIKGPQHPVRILKTFSWPIHTFFFPNKYFTPSPLCSELLSSFHLTLGLFLFSLCPYNFLLSCYVREPSQSSSYSI